MMPPAEGAIEVKFQVKLAVTEDTQSTYVNVAEVSATLNDVSILFARVPAKLSEMQLAEANDTGWLEQDALVEMVLPLQLITGLINALTIQRDVYESRYGKIPGVQ